MKRRIEQHGRRFIELEIARLRLLEHSLAHQVFQHDAQSIAVALGSRRELIERLKSLPLSEVGDA